MEMGMWKIEGGMEGGRKGEGGRNRGEGGDPQMPTPVYRSILLHVHTYVDIHVHL